MVRSLGVFFIFFMFIANEVFAGVVMYGTRVIFTEEDSSVVVKFANNDKNPNLMQVWIDNGEGNPDKLKLSSIPFNLTPPLFKIDAGEQQTVRIVKNSNLSLLKKDRETLYWFNFLQMPPMSSGDSVKSMAKVNLSFLNQVKVIYRPVMLIDGINDSWKKLTFTKIGNDSVQVSNNSGYYFTFRDNVKISNTNKEHRVIIGSDVTLAPFSKITWKIESAYYSQQGDKISFALINDKGNSVEHSFDI